MLEYLHLFTATSWGLRPLIQDFVDGPVSRIQTETKTLPLGLISFSTTCPVRACQPVPHHCNYLPSVVQVYSMRRKSYVLTSKGEVYEYEIGFRKIGSGVLYFDWIDDRLILYFRSGKVAVLMNGSVQGLNLPTPTTSFTYHDDELLYLRKDGWLVTPTEEAVLLGNPLVQVYLYSNGRLHLTFSDGTQNTGFEYAGLIDMIAVLKVAGCNRILVE